MQTEPVWAFRPLGVLMDDGLLTEISLGSGRGRQGRQADVPISIVRALTAEDLPMIQSETSSKAVVPLAGLQKLRHSHHRLAELVAKGLAVEEISLASGYAPGYISMLTNTDPAFRELVAYYEAQKATIFVDELERLRILGLDATEKLHEKLLDENEVWSKRELMELVDLALQPGGKGRAAPGQGQGTGASLQLEVKFVGVASRDPGIEATFTDITPRSSS